MSRIVVQDTIFQRVSIFILKIQDSILSCIFKILFKSIFILYFQDILKIQDSILYCIVKILFKSIFILYLQHIFEKYLDKDEDTF